MKNTLNKILTKNKVLNAVFLIPLYLFAITVFLALLFTWFDIRNSSNVIFVFGMIFINVSWIYLSRKIKNEKPDDKKKKDSAGIGILVYSGFCFALAFILSVL